MQFAQKYKANSKFDYLVLKRVVELFCRPRIKFARSPKNFVWPSKDDIKEYQRKWNKLTDGMKRQYRYKLVKEKRGRAEARTELREFGTRGSTMRNQQWVI